MSAIGNYVHYSAQGYLRYGISRNNQSQKPSVATWKAIKDEIRSQIQINFTQKEIEKMTKDYNESRRIIRGLNGDDSFKIVQDKIEELIKTKYEKSLDVDKIFFNYETGGVLYGGVKGVGANRSLLEKRRDKNNQEVDIQSRYGKAIWKRLEKASDELAGIPDSGSKNEIKKKLAEIKDEFLKIANLSVSYLKKEGIEVVNAASGKISDADAKRIVNQINTLMGYSATGALKSAIGDFEEYTAAAIALKAEGLAADEIVKVLENEIKTYGGSERTRPVIKHDMISISNEVSQELANRSNYTYQDAEGNRYQYFLSSSAQKMDARFIYDSKAKKQTGLSIKNYNLYVNKSISLVTASPLSSFLFNLDNVNTINHFLNILAWHKDSSTRFKNMRKIAEFGLGCSILYSAISGRNVGKSSGFADVFVVNDSSKKGDVKMYDVGMIVSTLTKNEETFKKFCEIMPDLSTIEFINDFISSHSSIGANIQMRLSYLLADVRKFKISASIKTAALQT